MLRELPELREEAGRLAERLSSLRLRDACGLPHGETLRQILREHPRATSADGLAEARDALGDGGSPGRVARLSALVRFLVSVRAATLEPGAAQELFELPRRPSVRPPGDAGLHGALPPVAVARDLPFERDRDKRAELEQALADAMRSFDGARAAQFDAQLAAEREGGLAGGGAQGFVNSVHIADEEVNNVHLGGEQRSHPRGASEQRSHPAGRSEQRSHPAGRSERRSDDRGGSERRSPEGVESKPDIQQGIAEAVLEGTEPLARDLGAWLLERNTQAKGGFQRHDLLHLLHAPRCAPAFPRGELVRTVRRWAEQLRLDLRELRLDEEDRPQKPIGAQAFATDPPYSATIALFPQEGPRALSSLLYAIGEAQLYVSPPSEAPPEDLWLADPAVRAACGALFEGLVREPQFLRRCAKAELGRDDERALAVAGVFDARIAAGRAIAARAARELGPGARAGQAQRDLFYRATGCELLSGLALDGLDALGTAQAELDGRALAAALRAQLRERFDEDWWRNPRALAPLAAIWSRGGRNTLGELWGAVPASGSWLVRELEEACR